MKRYISYFQSVITIGILTEAENRGEAERLAAAKLSDKNNINHCYFSQTDFDIADTEEWQPEFEETQNQEGLKFAFNPSEEVRNVIASRLCKATEELTQEDIAEFVKESVELSLGH